LEECDVYCIVSLPGGVFSSAGAGVKTNLVFFRKGDLSDVKVGKKKPLTKAAFEEFFQLLPGRGNSERSWTINFASRLERAAEEAKPIQEKAAQLFSQAKNLEDDFREKRKSKNHTPEALAELEEAWKKIEREARENQAKAQEIEDSIYDLKAVNPNRVSEQDTRTPVELLNYISEKGREADGALGRLRELIALNGAETPDSAERRV
jgi:type I restriction enzyme M protein